MADPRLSLSEPLDEPHPVVARSQIAEWIPTISSTVEVHMDMLAQALSKPASHQEGHYALTRYCLARRSFRLGIDISSILRSGARCSTRPWRDKVDVRQNVCAEQGVATASLPTTTFAPQLFEQIKLASDYKVSRLPLMAANCCHTNLASPTHPFPSTSSRRRSFCPSVPRLPKPRLPLVASTFGGKVQEQWLLDRSVHTCPVCSANLYQDQTCCPGATRPSTSLGPLPFGRPHRRHLQQRHTSLDGPRVITRKRGCKQNSKRSFNDVRRLCER